MPHFGFRDRLPTSFGSENLREKVVLFDDFSSPDPEDNSWTINKSSAASQASAGVLVHPNGLYCLGAVGDGLGTAIHAHTTDVWSCNSGVPLSVGASVAFDADATTSSSELPATKFASTGFFFGFAAGPISYALSPLTNGSFDSDPGIAAGSEICGFVRDVTTLEEGAAGPLFQLVHIKNVGGTYTNTRVPIQFDGIFDTKRLMTFGLNVTKNGLVKATIDDEDVAELRPSWSHDAHEILLSSVNIKQGSFPESLVIDYVYAAQDRAGYSFP
tara:strand:+ start:6795 stop:7610 length:816 start_codon:yes stop_codon:yes gene_type:complete